MNKNTTFRHTKNLKIATAANTVAMSGIASTITVATMVSAWEIVGLILNDTGIGRTQMA